MEKTFRFWSARKTAILMQNGSKFESRIQISYSLSREKVAEHSFLRSLRSLRSFVASFLLSFVPSFNFLVSQLTVKIFISYPNYSLGDNNISSKMRTRHYPRHLSFPVWGNRAAKEQSDLFSTNSPASFGSRCFLWTSALFISKLYP